MHNGDTGDIAADFFHRYPDDLKMLTEVGLNAYRFSIAWPRVQPGGSGALNPKGFDFYERLLDEIARRGITPMITLYHWDLPLPIQRVGGWLNRDTSDRFAEYANAVVERLGDRCRVWTTLNEPYAIAFFGHDYGIHAPGLADHGAALTAAHTLLLAHGKAVQAIRAAAKVDVGIVLVLIPTRPATPAEPDQDAARLEDGLTNGLFLDSVLSATYPDVVLDHWRGAGDISVIQPGDLETIAARVDFLGVNYYISQAVRALPPGESHRSGEPLADVPAPGIAWSVDPEALTALLFKLHDDHGDIPIYVTETGMGLPDYIDPEGNVKDPRRIDFLEKHIAAVERAVDGGVDVRGLFIWSLTDDFEWNNGYSLRYGLVYIDWPTQRRVPKSSYSWLRNRLASVS